MTMATGRLRMPVFALCLAAGLVAVEAVLAQEPVETIFLPAPRTMRQHLARAKKAVEEDRYGDAVAELGAVLTNPDPTVGGDRGDEPQDFFTGPSNATGTRSSLKTEAQRLLGALPARGRELYELQYGAEARALLDRAIQDGDLQKLNEVTRRFFHTRAGYEATLLLGRLHLDQGRPLAAGLCLQRVWRSPEARRFEPDLSILLAACFLQAHQPEKATQTLTALKQRFPRAAVHIGGEEVRRLPEPNEQLAWLQHHFGPVRSSMGLGETEWTMYRGNPARNARSVGGLPLRQHRWQAPTPTDPLDERLVADLQTGFWDEGRPSVPALHPLAVRDVVLMRTPERLLALDFKNGKRIWEYPWWDLSYQRGPAIGRAGTRRVELDFRRLQLTQRLWYDAPYGQVSSDGESVFLIDELRFTAQSRVEWIPAPGGGRRRNPNLPMPHNQLVSLDLSRQGALRWMVGGETGLDEPKLVGAFFLGPPLPLFGQLYVLAEIRGEIRLVVLDARTGRQAWSQQLAHVDSFTIAKDPRRRMVGASPSFADGVLVCPTSAGAVVGVDIATRSLLWGHQYVPASTDSRQVNRVRSYPGRAAMPMIPWLDATATIAEGAVLLTPPESNQLYCLDLITGKSKWGPMPREGDLAHMLLVACVYQGRVILIGQHHVTALKLEDGSLAWKEHIEFAHTEREVPSGRGFLSGKYYYLPTTASRLLTIDVEQGTVVERSDTGRVLGNLICHQDQVIAQDVNQIAAYFQIEPLRRQVANRLKASSEDAWALARQGELRVNDGDLSGALASLRKAHHIDPDDTEIRTLVVSTFLMALRDDFPAYRDLAGEFESLIEQPARQIEYLSRMGAGVQENGQLPEALETYLKLVDLTNREVDHLSSLLESPVALDTHWSARTDLWLGARLADLYAEADDAIRRQVDVAAQQRLDAALAGSRAQLANFIRFFGFHKTADRAALQLGKRMLDATELLSAERMLGGLEASPEASVAASALALLGELYQKAGRYELAARCYLQLADRWGDVICSNGKTGRQILDSVSADEMVQQGLAAQTEWPWGRIEWEEAKDGLPRQSHRRVYPVPIQTRRGPASRAAHVTYNTGMSSAIVRDKDGKVISQYRLSGALSFYSHQAGMTRAATWGNLLFLVLADQLAAVDTLRTVRDEEESVLWRDSVAQAVPDIRPQPAKSLPREAHNPLIPTAAPDYYLADQADRPLGQTGPLTRNGICYQKVRTLICADPLTGNVNWSRADVEQGAEVFGDAEFVFVWEGKSDHLLMLDAIDGRLLGRRPAPAITRPWAIHGRFMLCWEKVENGTRLYLYDAATSATVWSERFEKGSRGCVIGNDYVAVLRPDGPFVVRSLADARVLIDQTVQPEPKLGRIHAFANQGQLILLTSSDSSAQGTVNGGTPVIPITGRMYAFSEATGEPLWQVPAFLDDYGFPLDQPAGSPVLWFFRQYASRKSQRTPASSIRSAIACIDRRSGRLLFEVGDLQSQANFHEILADRDEQTVRLVIPGYSFRVKYTDEPTPPAPTAQTGSSASTVESGLNRLGRITNSLMKSLLGGNANEAPFDADPGNQPAEKPN
ncbi:MAG: PQQ-binding-like beta-propeller repeat protein [Pirellulaceae bacterium]